MVQRMLARGSWERVSKSLLSPLSTNRTREAVLAVNRVGLKASAICTGS